MPRHPSAVSRRPAARLVSWTLLLVFGATLPGAPAAWAAPRGERVVRGEARFTRDGDTTTIDTGTHRTVVDYDSFDIERDEKVLINQPSRRSSILNRVPEADQITRIEGQLRSNGRVYILNPAGIYFGGEAVVDVSGLVAGAGELSDRDFRRGIDRFTDVTGDVMVAAGAELHAARDVALVGRRVSNFGSIRSEGGMVALVAGGDALLRELDGHLIVRIDGGGGETAGPEDFALVQAGSVDAGAGGVSLAAGDTWSMALNHTGVTRGRDVQLEAQGEGLVRVAGTVDARGTGAGETGGSIRVLGEKLAVEGTLDASGDAGGGDVRVGGDVQGGGELPNARRTFVGRGARLLADALREGDGGTIVVFADEKTAFYGTASARGGAEGGDGGFVELSGRQSLEARGDVVLSAPNGRSGTLLYDPDAIAIRGGSPEPGDEPADQPDGSDADDLVDFFDGVVGNDEVFYVYESEIEGTDANIVLVADNGISVDRIFDNDASGEGTGVVVLMPGNSLTMQTTGTSADNVGIDLTTCADAECTTGTENEALAWRVSDGGTIRITTAATAEDASADVRIGRLEWDGRTRSDQNEAFPDAPRVGLEPDSTFASLDGARIGGVEIGVTTQRGDIEVLDGIVAVGRDAQPESGDDPATLAEDGGDVLLLAREAGDVTLRGTVDTRGGGSTTLPTNGGDGGDLRLQAGNGNVAVEGDADLGGGDGLAGERGGVGIQGAGGSGGVFTADARSDDPSQPGAGEVALGADIRANGGDGRGFFTFDGTGFAGVSGLAGLIDVDADRSVVIDGGAAEIALEASAGSASGPATPQLGPSPFAIDIQTQDAAGEGDPADGVGDILLRNVVLRTDGGDANFEGDGPGGAGGDAGGVRVSSPDGVIDDGGDPSLAARVEANGGRGRPGAEGPGGPAGVGGVGGQVTLLGLGGVRIGDIEATGGDGERGPGGLGGLVQVTAQQGDVVLADVDVSGGDVVGTSDVARTGGPGGDVSVNQNVELESGNVVLSGVVGGVGGTGLDGDGGTTRAAGADVAVRAHDDVGVDGPDALVRGGRISVAATTIGGVDPDDAAAALPVAGTPAEVDEATLEATGALSARVEGSELEVLEMRQHDVAAATRVHDPDALDPLLLVVDPDGGDPRAQVVVSMQTEDDAPFLLYRLDEQLPPADPGDGGPDPEPLDPPTLRIASGAVDVGANGGGIASGAARAASDTAPAENAGDILALGAGPHVATGGDFLLQGRSLGEAASPILVDGDPSGTLGLDAAGDIHVDTVDHEVGVVDVTQRSGSGETRIAGLVAGSPSEASTVTVSGGVAPVHRVDVGASDAGFAYRLLAPEGTETDAETPAIEVARLAIGGSGLLDASGDLHVLAPSAGDATIALDGGEDLVLIAGGDITADPVAGDQVAIHLGENGDDPADLVILAGGGVGPDGVVTTSHVDRVAAFVGSASQGNTSTSGAFRLENRGSDLEIAQIEATDPSGEVVGTAIGVVAFAGSDGDVEIRNPGQRIVLGAIPNDAGVQSDATIPAHVQSAGVLTLVADAIEIDNAQYAPPNPGDPNEDVLADLVPANRARLTASEDLVLEAPVDTAAGADAEDTRDVDPEDLLPTVSDVPGTLVLRSSQGRIVLAGDVGTTRALARLDTSGMRLAGDRTVVANEIAIRGRLDGVDPDAATATFVGSDLSGDADGESRVTFAGDVGTLARLAGLDVQADRIRFSDPRSGSAGTVAAGDGGIRLNADLVRSRVPDVATVLHASGGLALESSGEVVLGDREKLSVVGDLTIGSDDRVRVGDVSADRLEIRAPQIEIVRREPGEVRLPDGRLVMDRGTDLVANEMVFGSTPVAVAPAFGADDPSDRPRLYIGSGGLAMPGSLAGFEISRYAPELRAVDSGDFVGRDGRVLDLTGRGGVFAGDPSRQLARVERLRVPDVPAPTRGVDPAPAPRVGADQVLAFLRCASLVTSACDPDDAAALSTFRSLDDSSLATPRAREITERYRQLVAEPGAGQRLRAVFAEAGRAYAARQEWRDGGFDGASFYHFLEAAGEPAATARTAVRELAWLFAEVRLLGLDDADTRRLQRTLAGEFADAAGLPGFGADEVRAAVDATDVGLPEQE